MLRRKRCYTSRAAPRGATLPVWTNLNSALLDWRRRSLERLKSVQLITAAAIAASVRPSSESLRQWCGLRWRLPSDGIQITAAAEVRCVNCWWWDAGPARVGSDVATSRRAMKTDDAINNPAGCHPSTAAAAAAAGCITAVGPRGHKSRGTSPPELRLRC